MPLLPPVYLRNLRRATPGALAIAAGSFITSFAVHLPILCSGFRLQQADDCDSRFNNYLLEHSYRWITRADPSLWDLPICFPQPNLLASSDVMLSFGFAYWPWRLIGLAPDTAFQCWMLCMACANFSLAYLVLRSALKFPTGPAFFAALFFAIASPRAAMLGHQQLYPQVYLLLTLFALVRLFEPPLSQYAPYARRGAWMLVASAAIALQFYGGFYLGFFLSLALGIGAIVALCAADSRRALLHAIRDNPRCALASALLLAGALLPLADHYHRASTIAGTPAADIVTAMLPIPQTFVYMGDSSWLYHSLAAHMDIFPTPAEHPMGLGLLTLIIAGCGLYAGRRQRAISLATFSVGLLLLCTLSLGSGHSLWWALRAIVPGASAIRAVSRAGLLLIIPATLGMAKFLQQPAHHFRPMRLVCCTLLVIACLLEQLHNQPSFDKFATRAEVAEVARRIGPGAAPFFYTGSDRSKWYEYQLDAMAASQITSRPTLNGYTGAFPPALRPLLITDAIQSPSDRAALAHRLDQWAAAAHFDASQVTWIAPTPPEADPTRTASIAPTE